MSTALVSNLFCAAFGIARGPECGPWSDHAINGCICMALCTHTAARPGGCSCPRSIRPLFLWRSPPLPRSKAWGRTNTCLWSQIKRAGTRVPSWLFPKGCTCSFCPPIRLSFNPQNVCGRSPMNRLPIAPLARLTSCKRWLLSAAAGCKLILRSFAGVPPFTGGLLWTPLKRI